jgi:hypothetical protein
MANDKSQMTDFKRYRMSNDSTNLSFGICSGGCRIILFWQFRPVTIPMLYQFVNDWGADSVSGFGRQEFAASLTMEKAIQYGHARWRRRIVAGGSQD